LRGEYNMSKRKGSFLLLGALIGFIAGLFLAPKKGSELRKDAKNKIDEIKENPKDVLQETLEDVKGKINNFIDDNFVEEDNIHISEDEIVISRIFNEEGESK
jgi:gas vesicle protein